MLTVSMKEMPLVIEALRIFFGLHASLGHHWIPVGRRWRNRFRNCYRADSVLAEDEWNFPVYLEVNRVHLFRGEAQASRGADVEMFEDFEINLRWHTV